jgi:DNA-binding response OmpR family regulator
MGIDKQKQADNTIVILAIDDEPSLLRILKDILATNNMVLISARSADEAYQRLRDKKPALVLLDLILPDENGLTLCRYIKTHRNTRDVPVIILSVRSSEQDKLSGFEVGADDYITKPFNSGELKARIKSLLRCYAARNQSYGTA